MPFCTTCGTQIPDGATTCPNCAARVGGAGAGVVSSGPGQGLADNVAGMLAYITIIPAIIFLFVAPYNRNRFVRFHSFQCLFLFAALIVIHAGLGILTLLPLMGLMTVPLHALVSLGAFILWIVLLVKANQGEIYKVPLIGDWAEQQANAI